MTKIDHVVNSRNSVFARISRGNQNTYCDNGNSGLAPFPGLSCLVDTTRDPYNWAGSWRSNPASSIVNELVAGMNHFTFNFITPQADPSKLTLMGPFQVTAPEDHQIGNLRAIDTYQFVDNLSWARGAHSLKFGTNIRYQRHTDERGSVAGLDVSPWVDFSSAINTVDPAAFGIPGDINTAFDRPTLQTGINTLLGRVGNISQGFVQRGDSYAPGGTTFLFKAWFPDARELPRRLRSDQHLPPVIGDLSKHPRDHARRRQHGVRPGRRTAARRAALAPTHGEPEGFSAAGDVVQQHPCGGSGIPVAADPRLGDTTIRGTTRSS